MPPENVPTSDSPRSASPVQCNAQSNASPQVATDNAVEPTNRHQILAGRQVRVDRDLLRNNADDVPGFRIADRSPHQSHGAAVGADASRQATNHGRFAGAVWPQVCQSLARMQPKTDAIQAPRGPRRFDLAAAPARTYQTIGGGLRLRSRQRLVRSKRWAPAADGNGDAPCYRTHCPWRKIFPACPPAAAFPHQRMIEHPTPVIKADESATFDRFHQPGVPPLSDPPPPADFEPTAEPTAAPRQPSRFLRAAIAGLAGLVCVAWIQKKRRGG